MPVWECAASSGYYYFLVVVPVLQTISLSFVVVATRSFQLELIMLKVSNNYSWPAGGGNGIHSG